MTSVSAESGLLALYVPYPGRKLQGEIPDYTSPPLDDALEATPGAYRSDEVIDAARAAAASGNCTADSNRCQIPFVPTGFEESKVGVIFHGGALVDPRGYSPLAKILATRYGLPVVVPIFEKDLAFTFGSCDSGRVPLAQAEFEYVEKWVLAGHSFGGISAMTDAWSRMNDTAVAGLVVIAADVQQGLGCGEIDFSTTNLPMAAVTGSLDGILNMTRWELNKGLLSNDTLFVDIFGGNHGQFGSYNYSERTSLLDQVDGVALIPPHVQWDLTVASIYHVASRTGAALPQKIETECPTSGASATSVAASSWMWMVFLLFTWVYRRC
jgi:hypothetical protein